MKFRINDPDTGRDEWEVLLTNLDRFEFPLRRMKDIYHMRWDIETSFRELISFKDSVTIVRKYFRLHCNEPPDRIYAELLGFTRQVISGRADKRSMKSKSAVWFVYRVA